MRRTDRIAVVLTAVFVIQFVLPGIVEYAFVSAETLATGQYWRLFAHGAVHGGPAHLFYNTLALLVFGRIIEQELGPNRMTAVFIGGIVLGGVVYAFLSGGRVIGASGGTAALTAVAVFLYPTEPVYGYFPGLRVLSRVPIPVIQNFFTLLGLSGLTIVLGVMTATGTFEAGPLFGVIGFLEVVPGLYSDLVGTVAPATEGIAHTAHLGGYIAGGLAAVVTDHARARSGIKLSVLFTVGFALFQLWQLAGAGVLFLLTVFLRRLA